MKTVCLFQVYDNVGKTMITDAVPAQNKLTACLGFIHTYIQNKKSPYQYKALDLVRVAQFDVDEYGKWKNPTSEEWEISGLDILTFVKNEMSALGVDDFDIEDIDDQEI